MFNLGHFLPIEGNSYTCFRIRVSADATQEQIDALGLPKYVGKLRPNHTVNIDMTPNAATGEKNEAGAKRIAAFLKKAAHVSSDCEYDARCSNFAPLADFLAHHEIKVVA